VTAAIADVFRLFDMDLPPHASDWALGTVDREVRIDGGKRPDIVIRCPGRILLVIEVKVTDEQSAFTAKQDQYRKWIDRQEEVPYKAAVFLAVNAEPGDSNGGFKRRDWRGVCLNLRRIVAADAIAPRTTGPARLVRSALMLAFAGAVEQNLLDMPGRPLKLMEEGHLLNIFPVQKYLEEFKSSAVLRKVSGQPREIKECGRVH